MSTQTQAYVPYAVLLKQHEEAQKLKKVLATHVTGTVKWFSLRYHYGFIARDNETPDVFVHQMSIIKSRMKRVYLRSLAHGEKVEFDVVEGKVGPEASNVTGPGGADVQGYPLRPFNGSRRRRDSQDNIKPNRRERRHTENSDGSKSLTSSESRTRCRSENDGDSQEIKDPSLQQPQKAQRKNKRHRNRRHQTRTDSEIKAETPEKEIANVSDDVDAPNSQPANKSEKKSEAINGKTKKKGANKAVELEDEKANTDDAKADKPKVATPNNKAGDDEASKSEVDVAKTQKDAPTKADKSEVVNGKINKEGADKPVESEDTVAKTNNKATDGEASKPETDVAKADIDAINNFTKSEANCVFYKKNKKNVNKAAEVVDDKVNNKATDDAKADKPKVATPNNKAGDGEASKPEVDVAKTQKDAPTKADKAEVVNGKTNKKDANKPELDDEDDKDNAIVDDAAKHEIDVVEVNKDASSKVVKTEVVNGKNNNKATAGETDKVVQPEVVNGKPKYNKIAAFVQAFEKAK